jgi:hypothetical protein
MSRIVILDNKYVALCIPEALVIVDVVPAQVEGMQVFQVRVNKKPVGQFLSPELAASKARAYAQQIAQWS